MQMIHRHPPRGRSSEELQGGTCPLAQLSLAPRLARGGHRVYATMRDLEGRNRKPAEALRDLAREIGRKLWLAPGLDLNWAVYSASARPKMAIVMRF